MNINFFNKNYSSASAMAAVLLLSTPAFAETESADNAADAGNTPSEIIVTGSRIARPELESAMPVSVISMDDAFKVGRMSAYDAIALNPAIGVGQNLASDSSSWDAGTQSVNLRGLGVNRTLTLIDGQRRVSSSARSSAVDLGMIPVGMIERVEIVTGGAAAVYGADAVSGAVNIITKRHVNGLNVNVTQGISGQGDAGRTVASISTGGTFANDRGSFAIGGTYARSNPLHWTDRWPSDYLNTSVPNPANTGPADGIPDHIFITNMRQAYYGYVPNFWVNNTNWVYDKGVVRKAVCDQYATGQRAYCNSGDGRNEYDRLQLQGKNESIALMGRLDFDITDNIEYGAHFSYARQKYSGTHNLWRDDERTTFFSGGGGSVAYLDNPYLPDPVRQFMVGNNMTRMNINRTFGNFPIRDFSHDRTSFTIGQSIGGKLTDSLKWSAFGQYGRTVDKAVEGNIPYRSHWLAARDVISDSNGNPVCRNEAARAAGCVPLNIFSLEQPSDELLAYVMADRHERRVNTQQIYGANISGSLFALPYGDVSIAIGAEHRKETLATQDDPLALSGELVYAYGGTAHPELDVKSSVSEIYGEVVVPILKDLPFVKSLEIEGAYRYSDYDTFGGTHTWKAGGTWSPVEGITFRGVRSRSVRAPNFGELYEPQTSTPTGTFSDPCNELQYNLTPTRTANCIALGITTPLPRQNYVGPIVTTGGNPDLKPETSNSLTLGMVLQPRFLPGFDLTVDYWDIDIKNVITSFGFNNVLALCVDLPSINNAFCPAITRDPDTNYAETVFAGTTNASRLYARGVDLGANYQRNIGPGQLRLSFNGSYLIKQETETTPGIASGDVPYDGSYSYPRFRATLLTNYKIGNLDFALNTRFISASKYSLTTTEEYFETNKVPARAFNDFSIGYDFDGKYNMRLGIENVFDVMPPVVGVVQRNNTTYSPMGRYFNLTVGAKF